jgi:hypothetical protein
VGLGVRVERTVAGRGDVDVLVGHRVFLGQRVQEDGNNPAVEGIQEAVADMPETRAELVNAVAERVCLRPP